MSFDDDDDDAVVPSGSRRSSYVPPSEQGDFVPSLPPVDEAEAPTSSTGQIPTIGAAGDEQVAQTPVFAESVEVPRVDEERTQPTGSIIIEIPVEEEPIAVEQADSRDQFGLPLVGEPIDIPQVVVTDPLPEAVPGTGTGTVFDDNRLFPPAVGSGIADEVVEDPIIEEFGAVRPEPVVAESVEPVEPAVELVEPPVEHAEVPVSAPELPERRSLTPEQLASMLGANGGMSSNDQMALLDSQIPLRETDSVAVSAFVLAVESAGLANAHDLMVNARDRFGDLTPELFGAIRSSETVSEFTDDSTPITGIPLVEHVEIIDVVEDDEGEVVAVGITEIDSVVVVEPADAVHGEPVVSAPIHNDDQEWSLASPTDVVDSTPTKVERRSWWSVVATVATVFSTLVLAAGLGFAELASTPSIVIIFAGIAVALPIVGLARRTGSRTGASLRGVLEELFGRVSGRVTSVVIGILVLAGLIVTLVPVLAGLGTQLEESTVGSVVTGVVPAGSTGLALVALTVFGGAIVAALPHRLYRAKVLVLTGWTALGTSSVVAMGSALLLLSSGPSATKLAVDVTVAGLASSVALLALFTGHAGFSEVSRVREKHTGVLWISIGMGFGLVTLTGTVVAALLAADGAHYFFALNPVLHIIAPSPLLNVALGALALVPALILVSALVFRAIGTLTTRDDRENPNVLVSWILVLVPAALATLAVLGMSGLLSEYLPSLAVLATPLAAVVGVFAARGCTTRELTSRVARRWLVVVVIVTTALGLGFAKSGGAAFEWVGYINSTLRPLGYGLLYVGSVAPLATAVLSFLISLAIVLPSTRRSARLS
ncbi:MAG: hypothetical protein RJA31_576 [Actinomycetota bacterium]